MRACLSFLVLIGLAAASGAQEKPKIKPSQHGTVSQQINETVITVDYSRPVARGRELFGKLVPYGRIWCPGADDATTVEVSTGVTIEGKELPAGKYSLWTEPGTERWTVIFSKSASVWHTRYPDGQDALRVQVTPGPAAIWKRWRSTSRPWTAGKPSWRCIGAR